MYRDCKPSGDLNLDSCGYSFIGIDNVPEVKKVMKTVATFEVI